MATKLIYTRHNQVKETEAEDDHSVSIGRNSSFIMGAFLIHRSAASACFYQSQIALLHPMRIRVISLEAIQLSG